MNWHWVLVLLCALLGVVDILTFIKTPKEKRTKLHGVLLICGAVVLVMAAIQVIQLLVTGNPL